MQFAPNICIGVLPLLSENFAVIIDMKWKANDILDPTNIQTSWSHFKQPSCMDVMEECIPRFVLLDRRNLP